MCIHFKNRAIFLFLFALTGLSCDGLGTKAVPPPTPYTLELPARFPEMPQPTDNPLTVEGIALGRALFYEPLLSRDGSISCASCHQPTMGFSDAAPISKGVNGALGKRHAMPIMNLGWVEDLFWDGHAKSLEAQAVFPITKHAEMDNDWPSLLAKLNQSPQYPILFERAFGAKEATQSHMVKALAQFQRTLVSGNSKYDQWLGGEYTFTKEEAQGYDLFFTEVGDCFHCHGSILMTDNRFHNNGLDDVPADSGYYYVTKNPDDIGLFRSPSLRNIAYTAPYMHDGRFKTLEEVIQHYNNGVLRSPTLDPLMFNGKKRGLTDTQVRALIAFLHTLSDPVFLQNPAFQKPK